MLKQIYFIALGSLMAAGLAACSAHVDGGTPVILGASGPSASAPATVLQGNWASPCDGSKLTVTYAFAGNAMNIIFKNFDDAQCTKLTQQQSMGLTFSIGDAAKVDGAKNLNYVRPDGVTMYDIFKIDGDKLYLGLSPGISEASRSSELNTNTVYTKVK